MKLKNFLYAATAVFVVGGLYIWKRPASHNSEMLNPEASNAKEAQAATEALSETSAAVAPVAASAEGSGSGAAPVPVLSMDRPAQGRKRIEIRGGKTLATVNGVPITLSDLIPIRNSSLTDKHSFEPDRYNMLLSRAAERELAFQTAKAAGMGLTEFQQQSLLKRRAEGGQAQPGEFDNLGRGDINIEFEQRDAMGLMLLHNLAAASGVSPPYEQYRHFVEQLKTQARIRILDTL